MSLTNSGGKEPGKASRPESVSAYGFKLQMNEMARGKEPRNNNPGYLIYDGHKIPIDTLPPEMQREVVSAAVKAFGWEETPQPEPPQGELELNRLLADVAMGFALEKTDQRPKVIKRLLEREQEAYYKGRREAHRDVWIDLQPRNGELPDAYIKRVQRYLAELAHPNTTGDK